VSELPKGIGVPGVQPGWWGCDNEELITRTKEEVYDQEISPLMAQVMQIAKKNGIAMASFHIPSKTDPNLACTTALPGDSVTGLVVLAYKKVLDILYNRKTA